MDLYRVINQSAQKRKEHEKSLKEWRDAERPRLSSRGMYLKKKVTIDSCGGVGVDTCGWQKVNRSLQDDAG